jgi:Protein of unknown function (DUF935)
MANFKTYIQTVANAVFGAQNATNAQTNKLANIAKQDKRIITQILQQFTARSKQDIGSWRSALQMAENTQNPNRARLYNLYRDVMLDDQVSAVIGNLKASIKSEGFYIGKIDKAENDAIATELFQRPWFYDYIDACVDSVCRGYVLLELTGMATATTGKKGTEIMGFAEIPSVHVVPEKGIVVKSVGDENGIMYTDPAFAAAVLPIGKPFNLGLLNIAAPKAIIKKNVEAAWAEFCEMFGMPIRVGKVSSNNQKDIDRMEYFLKNMGSAAYAVTGTEDSIELKDTNRGDAYKVYEMLMERQDKAIAKIFLGQTMTTDNGSSRSQAEVHERIGDKRMLELKLFIQFQINFGLLPLLIANGYKLDGYKFYWDAIDAISDIDIAMDEFLVQNFEMANLDYFIKKYRVPITAIKANAKPSEPKPTKPSPKIKLSNIQLLNDSIHQLYNSTHGH